LFCYREQSTVRSVKKSQYLKRYITSEQTVQNCRRRSLVLNIYLRAFNCQSAAGFSGWITMSMRVWHCSGTDVLNCCQRLGFLLIQCATVPWFKCFSVPIVANYFPVVNYFPAIKPILWLFVQAWLAVYLNHFYRALNFSCVPFV
jgi:hypothetical protein